MKTAVIYARYSSERQSEQSIDGQLRACKEYAGRNDICILDTYIDRAMSGTNDNRVAFQKMLKDSDRKAWDIVLVYKLDRFSRDKYETAIHRKRLRDNGAKLVSAMENIPDTPEGIILEALLEGMNQYYSAELSQKIMRGMKENRAKGNFTGGIVGYGYKVVDKKILIDDEQAQIVKYIFNEYALGKAGTDILDKLQQLGVKNKDKPFGKNAIYKILAAEKYVGIYKYKDEVYTNMYPQIISQEIFDIVQKRIKENKYGKHKPDVCYLLKSKVKCGYCGKIVKSDSGTSKLGVINRYYKCSGKIKKSKCELATLRKDVLEQIIVDTIRQTLTPELISSLSEQILELHKNKSDDATVLNLLIKDYKNIQKSINNIMKAVEKGISTNTTKIRLEELEQQKNEIENKMLIERNKTNMKITKADIEKYLLSAINNKPQQMINLLINKIVLYNDKIEIYLNYTEKITPDDNGNHQVFSFYHTTKFIFIFYKTIGIQPKLLCYKITLLI